MNGIHLDGWTWKGSSVTRDDVGHTRTFRVQSTRAFAPARCEKKGCTVGEPPAPTDHFDSYLVVDIPAFGVRSRWVIERPTVKCRCGKLTAQPLPRYIVKNMTARCRTYILHQAAWRPFLQVADEIGVGEGTVRTIFKEIEKRRFRAPTPRFLGIDEIFLQDRWGDRPDVKEPRVVLTDLETGKVIDLLMTGAVDSWLNDLADGGRVRAVAMDFKTEYRKAVRKLLPQAKIIIDRFHVEQGIHKALDAVRVAEMKERRPQTLKKVRGRADRVRVIKKWLWASSPPDKLDEHKALDNFLKGYPKTANAYRAKQAFKLIWATSRSSEEARARFDEWDAALAENIRKPFATAIRRIRSHAEPVFAFFDLPITNASTEGANSRMRRILADGGNMKIETLRLKMLARARLKPREHFHCDACRERTRERDRQTSRWFVDKERLVLRYDEIWLCPGCKAIADKADPKAWPSDRTIAIKRPRQRRRTAAAPPAPAAPNAVQLSLL